MRVLYLDCQAGAAGDMLLGALVDAGADETKVRRTLESLDVPGWELSFERVSRGGVDANKARVTAPPQHEHRNLASIRAMLAALPDRVRTKAEETFEALATAEAMVHGTAVDEVHFHEVGALDAIVDVVGCCAALVDLHVDHVLCSPVPLGSGTVIAEHGTLPVPAPATLRLIQTHRIPVVAGGEGEAVTPTGAALLATIVDRFDELPAMEVEAVGHGAGDRDTKLPNVVRAYVGIEVHRPNAATHLLIEANIDDMAPELIPYAIGALLRAGADDAWAEPIQMKKDRQALRLSALTHVERRAEVLDALFRETTTFGCRIIPVEKEELERSWIETHYEGHAVRVKVARRAGEVVTMSPEYEDAVKAARATGSALKDVYYRTVQEAARRQERSR